jgi:hypothetical protein
MINNSKAWTAIIWKIMGAPYDGLVIWPIKFMSVPK